jgi:hypothetical protein
MKLDAHDYFMARHTDTNFDHAHLCVSRIAPNGTLWNDSHSVLRMITATEHIEKSMKLTQTRTLRETIAQRVKDKAQGIPRAPRIISRDEQQMIIRTGDVGSKKKAQIAARIRKEREAKAILEKEKANAQLSTVNNGRHEQANRIGDRERGTEIPNNQIRVEHVRSDQVLQGVAKGEGDKTKVATRPQKADSGTTQTTKPLPEAVRCTIVVQSAKPTRIKKGDEVWGRFEKDSAVLDKWNSALIDIVLRRAMVAGDIPIKAEGTNEFKTEVKTRCEVLGIPLDSPELRQTMAQIEIEAKAIADKAALAAAEARQQLLDANFKELEANNARAKHGQMHMK